MKEKETKLQSIYNKIEKLTKEVRMVKEESERIGSTNGEINKLADCEFSLYYAGNLITELLEHD